MLFHGAQVHLPVEVVAPLRLILRHRLHRHLVHPRHRLETIRHRLRRTASKTAIPLLPPVLRNPPVPEPRLPAVSQAPRPAAGQTRCPAALPSQA